MKVMAFIGVLFFIYSFFQVVGKWNYRNTTDKAIWFVVIAVGGGFCLAVLMR